LTFRRGTEIWLNGVLTRFNIIVGVEYVLSLLVGCQFAHCNELWLYYYCFKIKSSSWEYYCISQLLAYQRTHNCTIYRYLNRLRRLTMKVCIFWETILKSREEVGSFCALSSQFISWR
jgi:hypothetical protein